MEFDRVVPPPSGNFGVRGKQFWIGPARARITVTFRADDALIHVSSARCRSCPENELSNVARDRTVSQVERPRPFRDDTPVLPVWD